MLNKQKEVLPEYSILKSLEQNLKPFLKDILDGLLSLKDFYDEAISESLVNKAL